VLLCLPLLTRAQLTITGTVRDKGNFKGLESVSVLIKELKKGSISDSLGNFYIKEIPKGAYTFQISSVSYKTISKKISINTDEHLFFELESDANFLEEFVVSGTMKELSKMDSPVPVDIISPKFLYKNPNSNIFDALQNVNGVRPQINCNICSTGDIHINGLEGPYTMVLIDGMPIVSSLSTVYGLSGIPNSLIDRVEVIKGPASSLYGSEAIGGLINIITKNTKSAPKFSFDSFLSSWGELNLDAGFSYRGKKASSIVGINAFRYNQVIDNNLDGFTDLTLQNRISVFNKWNFDRAQNRLSSIAIRGFYEDRWGGQTHWKPINRGGDEVYGESIYTNRFELIGAYQIPSKEKIMLRYSYNFHDQNSVYGTTPYLAKQQVLFSQLTYDKEFKKHGLLLGIPIKYTYYDDNTSATSLNLENNPDNVFLPGIFIQDEWKLNSQHKLLLGLRYDYNSKHGNIFTPRLAYQWNSNSGLSTFRYNLGKGFRIVNLFTEDHASLSGAREVVIAGALKPEQSWNNNVNFVQKFIFNSGFLSLDASAFYTYFNNQILPDYSTNSSQIIYDNLSGHAVSKGLSLNLDLEFDNGLSVLLGSTLMDVSKIEAGIKSRQVLTERFSGTWTLSYQFLRSKIKLDYTGNLTGSMLLPTLNELDPRPGNSPLFSIQNLQISRKTKKGLEFYGGIKNMLNINPAKKVPFLIARAHDPFDKNIQFNTKGNIIATEENPYALSFDPTYVYASQQGRRLFLGLRYSFN
jgi:outer membrane receptor for ferrienterochelin and colicins